MEQDQVTSTTWWKISLWWAIGLAVLFCFLLPSPIKSWKLIVTLAMGIFLVLCWWNPKYRYRRLATQMLMLWAASRFGSRLFLYAGSDQSTLAFAFENESSALFDASIAACIVLALLLDFLTRADSRIGKNLRQLFSFQVSRSSTETNLGNQTNIGSVAGDIHVHQVTAPPTQQEVDDALSAEERHAPLSVREDAYHDQIDAAVAYMKDDNVDVAIALLVKLKQRSWDKMSDRHKFRTLANLGHCYSRKGDHTQALASFREALRWQPNDLDGRCYVSASLYSSGKEQEAKQLAEEILSENPDAAMAHAIVIRTSSPNVDAESLWNSLPSTVRNSDVVLSAIGWRAANQQDYDFAKQIAENGVQNEEAKKEFEILRSASEIGEVSLRILANPPANQDEIEKLNGAIQTLKSSEQSCEKLSAKDQLGQVHYYLACAYRLLGQKADTDYSYRQSIKAWPSNLAVARQYVIFLNDNDRLNEAIAVLDENKLHENDVESCVLYAACLAERNEPGDKGRALSIIRKSLNRLSEVDLATVSNALNVLAILHAHNGTLDEAFQDISEVDHYDLTDAHRKSFLAYTYGDAGQNDKAQGFAKAAINAFTDSEDEIGLWDVASSCMKCGLYEDALSIYQRFVTPHSQKKLIMAALECADRSENALFLIDFCHKLRSNGIILKEAIELEAVTRETFDDVEGALESLDSYLSYDSASEFAKLVVLRKAVLGIKYDKPDLLQVDETDLPTSDVANGHVGALVVAVLREQGKDQVAREYAYDLLRRNFDDPDAHKGFVESVGPPGREAVLPVFETAQLGSAVQYETLIGEEQGWWIIEDSPEPVQERRELDAEHPIAQSLKGKKVGDEFVLRSSDIQDFKARILKITSKYQYRYADIFDNWQDRFPDNFFVWKVTMPTDEEGQPDIDPILKSLDNKAKQTEKIHDVYRQSPMSIASFSAFTKTDAIAAASHLAETPDLEIRCCFGNDEEHRNAVACTGIANKVVLCPSAVATLWLVRAYEEVADFPFTVIIPRGVKEQVRRKKIEFPFFGDAFLSKRDGQYVLTQNTEEQRTSAEEEYHNFYNWLESVSETVDALALAELPPDSRNKLKQIFGGDAAQSIAVAKKQGIPLWTDDLGIAELARNEFDVERTWTEVVLCNLRANEKINEDKLADFIAALNGCGYRHSRITPEVIVASAKIANWNPNSWPFPSILTWCKNPDINPLGIVQIVSFSLPMLWRTAAMTLQAETVSRPLLESIKGLSGGSEILRAVIDNIDQIFSVNVLGADQCRSLAEDVLSDRPPRRLILPDE